jgi:nitrogen fixation negative regulator NifL
MTKQMDDIKHTDQPPADGLENRDSAHDSAQMGPQIVPGVFRKAVEHVPVATSITDADANILYVNPAFEALTGYSQNELIGKNESLLSDKSTPVTVYQDLWKNITSGQVWEGRLVNRRKDGSSYLADLTVVPVLDDNGSVMHYMGMHRDVTGLHQLERKVKNQDALITSVIEAAPVVIVLVNTAGKIVFCNPAYVDLKRDFGGMEVAGQFVSALKDSFGQDLKSMCEKGFDFAAVEVSIQTEAGDRRWFACSATKVEEQDMTAAGYFDSNGLCGVLLVANDITHQRRRYEQARTNAVRALMAEQQMAQGMREVISGAIFQLQGPLNVMGAAASMLERQGQAAHGLSEPIHQVISAGEAALERLKASMPRTADEPIVPVNVNELIREVMDVSIDGLLREGVVVEWHPASVLPNVPGRANALRSLVKYLVDNAIMAIKDGGDVREMIISTRATDGGDVMMEIRDSGQGFDDGILYKAFEPFFTAWKKTRSRPGMGLVLARQIITDQGGSIQIGNALTGGGRVEIVFAAGSLGHGQKRTAL